MFSIEAKRSRQNLLRLLTALICFLLVLGLSDKHALRPEGQSEDLESGTMLPGQKVSGTLHEKADADVFYFMGVAGESVKIAVNATGGGLDPTVSLFLDASRILGNPISQEQAPLDSSIVPGVKTLSFADPLPEQAKVFVRITAPTNNSTIPIPTSPSNIQVDGVAGITGTGVPTNLEIAIVLDVSGSISSDQYNLEAAGARAIFAALDPDGDGLLSSSVAIIQFSTSATITAPLTRSKAQLEAGLKRLSSGSTYYDAAMTKALEALAPSSATDSVAELVLFFSDGSPTSGTYTKPGSGGPLDQFRPRGIRMDTFGIGSGASPSIMTEMAQATGGTFTLIPTFNDVPRVTSSLPGVVGLQSVVLDLNGDGRGDVTANVAVDGSWRARVPIRVGSNTITAIATATAAGLAPATDTITVIGQLVTQVGNNLEVIHDDNSGGGVNALIRVFQLPATGRYMILIASSGGQTSGTYELSLSSLDQDSNVAAIMFDRPQLVRTTGRNRGQIIYTANSVSTFAGFNPDGGTAAILFDRPQLVHTGGSNPGQIIYTANSTSTFLGFSPDSTSAAIMFDRPQLVSTLGPNAGRIYYTANSTSTFLGFSPDGETAAVMFDRPQLVRAGTNNPGQIIYTANSTSTFLGFSPDGETAAIMFDRPQLVQLKEPNAGKIIYTANSTSTFLGFSPDGETAAIMFDRPQFVQLKGNNAGKIIYTANSVSTFLGFSPDGNTGGVLFDRPQLVRLKGNDAGKIIYTANSTSAFSGFSPDGANAAILFDRPQLVNTRDPNPGRILYTANSTSTFSGFAPDGGTAAVFFDRPQLVTLMGSNPGRILYTANSASTFGGFSPDGATVMVMFDRPQLVTLRGTNPGNIIYTANSASTFNGFSPEGTTAAVFFDRPQLVTLRGTNPGNIIYTANSTSVFGGFSFDGATAAVLFDRPQLVFTRGANPGRIIYTANSVSTFGGFSPDGDTACILFDRPQLVNTREPNPGQIIYTANSTSAFSGFSLDSDTAVVLFDRPQLVNTRSPNPGQIVYTANSTSTFSSFSFDRTRGTGLGAISTCDIDGDGSTDVNDLQTLALRILSGSGGADLNNDGITNIQDLQLLANVILRIITCPGDTTTTTSTSTTIRTTTTTSTTTSSTTTTRTTTSTTTTRATTSTTTTTTLPLQCNLFNYNFSSGNIAEWAVEGGTWQILGGQFQVSNITNNPALALYRRDLPFPALFRMEMDITVQTNETNPSLWVGGFEPYSDRGQIFNFQLAGGGTLTIDGIGAIRLADGRAAFFTYHPDSTGGYAEGFYSFGAANYGQVNRLGIQWASDSICIIINGAIPNQGCYPPALLGLTSIPPPGLNKLALAASGATTTTRFANICEGDPFYALSVPENAGNLINEPVIVTPIAPAMLKPARKEQ